jgi:hypothetical protein
MTIIELLRDNGGCQFPCWWGIMPGETGLQTSRSLLETFESIVIGSIFDDNGGYARWFLTENDLIIDIDVNLVSDTETVTTIEGLWVVIQVHRRLDDGGEIVWESPINDTDLQAFTLPQILSTYGRPEDVLIRVNRGWVDFDLILDYSTQGFALWYIAPSEHIENTYRLCVINAYIHLAMWNPDMAYTWAEGITMTTSGEPWEVDSLIQDFVSLEERSNLTIDDFFQNFKNPEYSACIDTSDELWPGP